MLRHYQQKAIDLLYDWLPANEGNPCLVLPTGSGKSHIIAALCKDALQNWPTTRILMLSHVKEILEQNASKLRQHWRNAPFGIYSASMKRRELGEPITFAGIQSVHKKADLMGHVDLVIIDEAHTVGHRDEGRYRNLLNDLREINPHLRIVGLTASPYRLGHGMITDHPAIFDGLIEPVTIAELVKSNFLAPLRSRVTKTKLDATGIKKRGGDYIESELQKAFDLQHFNDAIADEIIEQAAGRKSWLIFCTGIKHAYHMRDEFVKRNISCESINGGTSKPERERILNEFKSGQLQCITNVSVLTTGFDAPNMDLIAFLRPTMSPGLYLQMAGRGMRLKDHTDHCLVLDFAGLVAQHGPITSIEPPRKKEKPGQAPTKNCPECGEILHTTASACHCGYKFPEKEETDTINYLHDDDIMGIEMQEMKVDTWQWRKHKSRTSGKEMLAVDYYESLFGKKITEYFPVTHGGYAGRKAIESIMGISRQTKALIDFDDDLKSCADQLSKASPPVSIHYKQDGKFARVTARTFQALEKIK